MPLFAYFLSVEMATLAATEPVICPNAIPAAESVVPACMFAPDRGCEDDPCGTDDFEDCDGTNGDTADHLDLSSKVGLTVTASCYGSALASFRLELYVLRRLKSVVCASVTVRVFKVTSLFCAGYSEYFTVTRMELPSWQVWPAYTVCAHCTRCRNCLASSNRHLQHV